MKKQIGQMHFANTWNVKLTQNAVQRIRKLSELHPDKIFKVSLTGGGCQGYVCQFDLDENQNINRNDIIYEQEGARIITDSEFLQYFQGILVDLKNDIIESKFVVSENPNQDQKCSCGGSISPS